VNGNYYVCPSVVPEKTQLALGRIFKILYLSIFRKPVKKIQVSLCAVLSLEPLAQDPRDSEITDMRYVNLFTPVPLPCSTLTEARKPSCGDHCLDRLRSLHYKISVWG
jgi:hypothetical protein